MAVAMIGPKFYAWDRDGKPLAFGKLYTYQARTNTPKPTYQSEDQIVPNTNPVILNGEGYANVYLSGSYKMVLKDKDENEIWSSDPVSASQPDEWVNCLSATYLSPLSFKVNGNFVAEYEVGRRVRLDNNTSEYAYATIRTSTFAAGKTTVTIDLPVITTGLVEVCVSIVGPESRATDSVLSFDSLQLAVESTYIQVGDAINLKERVTGSGGGAIWDVVLASSVSPNGFDIVICEGITTLALVLRKTDILVTSEWGAISGEDNTLVYQALASYMSGLSEATTVRFSDGTSDLSATTVLTTFPEGTVFDFGTHKFNLTAGRGFEFGDKTNTVASPTPNNKNLTVKGGFFDQVNNGVDKTYINVYDTQNVTIHDVNIDNVGNGGITIGVAVNDFEIYNITGSGVSNNSVRRAIWINMASVAGYTGQVLDTSTLKVFRSEPASGLRGSIHHCKLLNQSYGIYLMNTRDVRVHDNTVSLDPANALRCVAINNYSPRAMVYNNRFESSVSSTGILITQGSIQVLVHGNQFFGSFGGNRDIYVQYGAEATIYDNYFRTDSTQQIEVNHGGFAIVERNTFKRNTGFNANTRCLKYDSIDPSSLSAGGTATEVGGLIFKRNIIFDQGIGAIVTQNQSTTNSNYVGCGVIEVSENIAFQRDQCNHGTGQAILTITINDDAKPMNFSFKDNTPLPYAATNLQSTPKVIGTAVNSEREVLGGYAIFQYSIVSGSVTTTKLFGNRFKCSGSVIGNDLQLVPRTGEQQAGVGVARILSAVPASDNVAYVEFVNAGASVKLIRAFNAAGSQISLTTTDAKIIVMVGDRRTD